MSPDDDEFAKWISDHREQADQISEECFTLAKSYLSAINGEDRDMAAAENWKLLAGCMMFVDIAGQMREAGKMSEMEFAITCMQVATAIYVLGRKYTAREDNLNDLLKGVNLE